MFIQVFPRLLSSTSICYFRLLSSTSLTLKFYNQTLVTNCGSVNYKRLHIYYMLAHINFAFGFKVKHSRKTDRHPPPAGETRILRVGGFTTFSLPLFEQFPTPLAVHPMMLHLVRLHPTTSLLATLPFHVHPIAVSPTYTVWIMTKN